MCRSSSTESRDCQGVVPPMPEAGRFPLRLARWSSASSAPIPSAVDSVIDSEPNGWWISNCNFYSYLRHHRHKGPQLHHWVPGRPPRMTLTWPRSSTLAYPSSLLLVILIMVSVFLAQITVVDCRQFPLFDTGNDCVCVLYLSS